MFAYVTWEGSDCCFYCRFKQILLGWVRMSCYPEDILHTARKLKHQRQNMRHCLEHHIGVQRRRRVDNNKCNNNYQDPGCQTRTPCGGCSSHLHFLLLPHCHRLVRQITQEQCVWWPSWRSTASACCCSIALLGGAKEITVGATMEVDKKATIVHSAALSIKTMTTRMTTTLTMNGWNTKGGGTEASPGNHLPPLSVISQNVEEGGEMIKQTTEKRIQKTTQNVMTTEVDKKAAVVRGCTGEFWKKKFHSNYFLWVECCRYSVLDQ